MYQMKGLLRTSSRISVTPESPETAPESISKPTAPKYPRNRFSALRKACTALVVGALLITGAGCASHGVSETSVDAAAVQIHRAQASIGGPLGGHIAQGKGGLMAAPVAAVTKAGPVIPVAAQHDPNERIGTVSIPRLSIGSNWKHYLVEGVTDENLALPGTDAPDALQNHETAVVRTTKTSELGQVGNVVLQAHRTPNTFGRLNELAVGDTISVTEAKTGTVYTYAVTKPMVTLPFVTAPEQDKAWSVQDPIQFDDNSISTEGHPATHPATQRLLTLTSCGLDIKRDGTSDWRVYVTAELQAVNGVTVK